MSLMIIKIKIEPIISPIKKYANWDKSPKQFIA
jgi:hypothetical protein